MVKQKPQNQKQPKQHRTLQKQNGLGLVKNSSPRSKDAVAATSVTREVDTYLAEFESLDDDEQTQLLDDLSSAVTPQPSDFVCTILDAPITLPCKCLDCGFFTESKLARFHCLLYMKFELGVDTFSVDQLSSITQIPSSRIKSSVDAAFNSIRRHNIKVEIATGNYNHFTYRGGVDVCVVCSAPTPKRPFVVDVDSDLRYCSRTCYKKRPPSLIRLEIEFGVDIRVILAVARKVLKRLPLIASALDVKRKLLLRWYDEFLGISASVFGSDAVDVVDVMRRSSPKHSWALDFLRQPQAKLRATTPQRFASLEVECTKLCRSL